MSVTAFQLRSMREELTAFACRLCGTPGGVTSVPASVMLTNAGTPKAPMESATVYVKASLEPEPSCWYVIAPVEGLMPAIVPCVGASMMTIEATLRPSGSESFASTLTTAVPPLDTLAASAPMTGLPDGQFGKTRTSSRDVRNGSDTARRKPK